MIKRRLQWFRTDWNRRRDLRRWGFYFGRTIFTSPKVLDIVWAIFWLVLIGFGIGYLKQGDTTPTWASVTTARSAEQMAETLEQSRRSFLEILEDSSGRGGVPFTVSDSPAESESVEVLPTSFIARGLLRLREGLPPFAIEWGPVVLILFGLIVGLRRFQIGREDAAIDRYFERRDSINKMLLKPEAVRARRFLGAATPNSVEFNDHHTRFYADLFVFSELDQLEYVFEKYRLRLMPRYVAHRACQVMISRSSVEIFRDKVLMLVETGRYTPEFQTVVEALVEEARSES